MTQTYCDPLAYCWKFYRTARDEAIVKDSDRRLPPIFIFMNNQMKEVMRAYTLSLNYNYCNGQWCVLREISCAMKQLIMVRNREHMAQHYGQAEDMCNRTQNMLQNNNYELITIKTIMQELTCSKTIVNGFNIIIIRQWETSQSVSVSALTIS